MTGVARREGFGDALRRALHHVEGRSLRIDEQAEAADARDVGRGRQHLGAQRVRLLDRGVRVGHAAVQEPARARSAASISSERCRTPPTCVPDAEIIR